MTLLFIVAALLAVGFLGPIYRPTCPECHQKADRVIHAGIPMWICFGPAHASPEGEPGALGLGLLSMLLGTLLPWDGWFCLVDGPYLPGLWVWWRAMGCTHGEP